MNLRQYAAFLIFLLTSVTVLPAGAQQNSNNSVPAPKSLAEIAKESKQKASVKPRKVFTDEDLKTQGSPLPRLNLNDDNSDEIVQAIGDLKSRHTPEETENIVHDWYDEYDQMLITAIRENNTTAKRRQFTNYSGYWFCQTDPNYQNCVARRMAEMRGAHNDQEDISDNSKVISQVQQTFMRVRSGMMRLGLTYSWFKIRNANGFGSF